MCLLILLLGVDPEYPIIIANNRDEFRGRQAAPPGLYVGESHRLLSPRDRVAGGTWIAINDAGMFAGITNLAGAETRELTTTRGELPHLALDQDDLESAAAAVIARCAAAAFNPFQLLLTDGESATVLVQSAGSVETVATSQKTVLLTNHHRLDQLELPNLPAAAAPGLALDQRLAMLRAILTDPGESSGHPILKTGGDYGTVSSALIAVPAGSDGELVWRYAPGPPDVTEYRNYGNLGRRLVQPQ